MASWGGLCTKFEFRLSGITGLCDRYALISEFGLTYREIEKDGFTINAKVDSLISSDSPAGISKAVGLGSIAFGDCLETLKPDLLVVLGDRFEILPAVFPLCLLRYRCPHSWR